MTLIRSFLALPLPDTLQNYLAHLSDPFLDKRDRINWVAPQNIHITLSFLGDTDLEQLDNQAELLSDYLAAQPALQLITTDTGVFPHANDPRVLWVKAVALNRTLQTFQLGLTDTLRGMGYQLANRKFQQHITLGRVKSISRKSSFVHDFLTADVRKNVIFSDEVKWFESKLTPAGAVYTTLKTFKLKLGGPQ